jgi:fused signal recognition particle receptor
VRQFARSVFERIKSGLKKTKEGLSDRILGLLSGNRGLQEKLDSIEEALIESDIGVDLSLKALEWLKKECGSAASMSEQEVLDRLARFFRSHFLDAPRSIPDQGVLAVVLFTGINGTGKTTTLAKIARSLQNSGKKVMLAACDTFRAAAIEQLGLWGEKLGVSVVRGSYGADPASVAFDAIDSAAARGMDYLLIDTAGRLHSRKELMEELKKILRVCEKKTPASRIEKLFILDGTAGQNGFHQAQAFSEAIGLDGIVVTKLDGTAKGGIVVAIEDQLRIPVKFIGVGEAMEDLVPFDPDAFVEALFK